MSGKNEEKEGGVGEGEGVEAKTNVEPDGRLVWSALDEGTTAELLSDELRADVDGQYKRLADVMGLSGYETNPRQRALLDFHFYNLQFAQEVGFSDAQTSAFFSIMKDTIEHASASSGGGSGRGRAPPRPTWEPLNNNFDHFRGLVMLHVTPKPGCEPLLSLEDVKQVTSFITKSFYRHYAAYSVVFCERQQVQDMPRNAVVETPMRPPPLSAGELQ